MIKENVKAFAYISAKTFTKWISIGMAGGLISIIYGFSVLFLEEKQTILVFLSNLFSKSISGFILFIGTPLFMVLYLLIANKIAIQTFLYQIWKNKAQGFLQEKVKGLVNKLTSANNWTSHISTAAVLKLKLLTANKNDKESNFILRKSIGYLLSMTKLDDIDFKDENIQLSEIVAQKLGEIVGEFSKPSLLFFWLLLLFQTALFVVYLFARGG
jgi:hypothetical protein